MSTKGSTIDVPNAAAETQQALALFKNAAASQTTAYNQGLQYYKTSLDDARKEFQNAYTEANSTLRPLSDSSNKALNEQMKMMGLDPISATQGYVEKFKNLTSQYGRFEGQDQIVSQMQAAETIKDPAQRTAALSQIQNQINSFTSAPSKLQDQISALGGRPTGPAFKSARELLASESNKPFGQLGLAAYDSGTPIKANTDARYAEYAKPFLDAQAKYDSQVEALKAADAQNKTLQQQVGSFGSEYGSSYTPEYQAGYTGQQATQRLSQTPGYQFQLDQGTRATERQGAARGMLGSGNTLSALQDFGQSLAQNTYQGYMNNLAGIIAQGSGATAAISNNQIALGNTNAGLTQLYGQAQMNTQNAIGNANASSQYQQGQLTYAAANAQANRANSIILGQMKATAAADASSTTANMSAAALNQQATQFQYQVQQGQQQAQGFLQGSGNGGGNTNKNSGSSPWANYFGGGNF
jgi:hypothetical protein